MGVVIYMLNKVFVINAMFLITSLAIVLYSGNILYIGLFLAAIYLFVAYSKECRGIESIWIFMLVAVGFIPINVAFEIYYHDFIFTLTDGIIGKILSVVMVYTVLFSLEELFAGIIGRIIWRHQEMDE